MTNLLYLFPFVHLHVPFVYLHVKKQIVSLFKSGEKFSKTKVYRLFAKIKYLGKLIGKLRNTETSPAENVHILGGIRNFAVGVGVGGA